MAANCPPLADRMLYRHIPALNPTIFHKNSGGGLLSSVQWLNEFHPRLHLRLHVQEMEPHSPIIRSSSRIKSSNCQAAPVVDDETFGSLSSSSLMIVPPMSEAEEDDDCNDYFHFFSITGQKKLKFKKKLGLRWQRKYLTPDDAVCIGSTHGWLVFIDPGNCNIYLFNPLKQKNGSSFHEHNNNNDLPYIPLPSLETLGMRKGLRTLKSDYLAPSPSLIREELFVYNLPKSLHPKFYSQIVVDHHKIQDVVLSSSPSSLGNDNSTVTVVMIYVWVLYFCRLGVDERWTCLPDKLGRNYCDVTYFSKDGRFYALGDLGFDQLEAWDLSDHSSPKHSLIDPTFSISSQRTILEMKRYMYNNMGNCWRVKYLVESSGDLLLVFRLCARSKFPHDKKQSFQRTVRFVVHKLNFELNTWEHVECLNDRALFVGYNHSYSLSTRDYPELMENSIYFTENSEEIDTGTIKGHDNGVFHLEDNSVTFYRTHDWKRIEPHSVQVPSPVWVCIAQNDARQ